MRVQDEKSTDLAIERRGGCVALSAHHVALVRTIIAPSPRYRLRLVCSVLVNSDTLTANYSIKQSQFTKPTSEPRASDPEESNGVFDRAIRGWY